jgi:N-acetylmuramic acid 6-phosphate etherase
MNNSELIFELNRLVSEEQNPETLDIDLLPTTKIVEKLNQQDQQVAIAVKKIMCHLSQAVDRVVEAFKNGGRLVYVGAGTSGRLGVLDAVECVPTFGVDPSQVVALMAGGETAMFRAKEGIEDKQESGITDLVNIALTENDVVVGIAASGRTPYVIGALEYAKKIGAGRIALSCNPNAEIAQHADIALLPVVGPEPLTGSTRMKSGTAQKMVLNILSTASMIRIGKTYRNLMVDVKASNEKLYARGTKMVMQITGANQSEAEEVLRQAKMQVKLAILMLLAEVDAKVGESMLEESGGFLRKARKVGIA